MGVMRSIELYCDGRDKGALCFTRFEPPLDAPYKQTRTVAALRRFAKKDGWTHVPHRIGRMNFDKDFCPKHKPEPEDDTGG